MSDDRIVFRLAAEGKDQIVADFRAIGEAGDESAKRMAASIARDVGQLDTLINKVEAKQAKLAAIGMGATNRTNPVGDPYGATNKSAEQSAAILQQVLALEDAQIAKAQALKAVLDPVAAAQDRYNRELAELKTLAPHLTVEQMTQAERRLKAQLDQNVATLQRNANATNSMRMGAQMAGYQVQDFFIQVQGGTSVMRAFSQQAPQLIGNLQMMAYGAENGKGKFAQFANVISGPWGIALGIAIPVAGMLVEKLLDGGSAADSMAARQSSLATMIDQTTGRLKEQNQALIQNQILLARKDAAAAQSDFQETQRSLRMMRPGDADLARIVQFVANNGNTSKAQQYLNQLVARKPWLSGEADALNQRMTDFTEQARLVAQARAQERLLSGQGRAGDAKTAFGDFSRGTDKASVDMAEINAKAKLAAATSDVERAQANLTLVRKHAEDQLKAGKITEAQATAQIAAAETTLNNAQAAQQAMTKARRDDAKATREALKDQREAARLTEQYQQRSAELDSQLRIQMMRQQGMYRDADHEEARLALMRQFAELDQVRLNHLIEQTNQVIDQKHAYEEIMAIIERMPTDLEIKPISDADMEALMKIVNADVEARGGLSIKALSDDAKDLARTINQDVDGALKGMMRGFGDLGDLALNVLYSIGDALIDNLLNAGDSGAGSSGGIGGAIAGVIGGLFGGGGAAIGTEYASGGAMWLAENGPELVNLPRGARVTPAAETRRLLAGANDNRPTISFAPVINAPGADAAALARVEAKLEQMRRDMPSTIAQTMVAVNERTHGRWQGR